jgi:hypothetical protein
MRKLCGCKRQTRYDKIRTFVLRKLLTFFGRMENKLWRELFVFQPAKRCQCKPKTMEEFTKRVSAQSPNPEMFNHCVVNDDKDYL